MGKKALVSLGVIIVIACVSGLVVWNLNTSFPDTLALDENPQIILPLYDYSNVTLIQGYGQVEENRFHNGIDFVVNDSTTIVAPCEAYVLDISLFENEVMKTWQTNLRLRLNSRWSIIIAFESWAFNETYGRYQFEALTVQKGDHVSINQTLGALLHHGDGSHIHFGILDKGDWLCPYPYLTPNAKQMFEDLYIARALGWPSGNWCKI